MNRVIVACRTIADELDMAMDETGCTYPVHWIDSGLHLYPDSLKNRLQEELNQISKVDQVLMAFGFCGNALLGIKSPSYSLILPRVDDCITLLLGSLENRKRISQEMGTYFLTKGWLAYEKNIWVEYQETVNRHGKTKADRVYKIMLQHYKRLGIIETGAYDLDEFLEKGKLIAQELNLIPQILPGTLSYLKQLLTGPWDDGFIEILPGETIGLEHLSIPDSKSAVTTLPCGIGQNNNCL